MTSTTAPGGVCHYCSASGFTAKGDKKSTITYDKTGARISYRVSDTACHVYIPMTNPPSKTAKLMKVRVACQGSDDGTIEEVWVYYGKDMVLNSMVSAGDVDFETSAASTQRRSNSKWYGINVTLKLSLPKEGSYVELYSVTLEFGEP